MCYSAQVWADYRRYCREFGAELSIRDFVEIYGLRSSQSQVKIPRSMDAAFADPGTADELLIRQLIDEYNAGQIAQLEQEAFKQKKRLADAERALLVKVTKKDTESQRIAGNKVEQALSRLADLKRAEAKPKDSRIFPRWYAPVLVVEDGRRIVKPMRYQCRPVGKPAFYDTKYPGTYNARRDNLEGFWRGQFGYTHGVMVVNRFYENVSRHAMEGRELAPGEVEENVVLEFKPNPEHDMLIACLWSRWTGAGEPDLLSFAAITDEPPAEVRAAGHDRCIIAIKPENVDAWLNPDPANLVGLYRILDDKDRPYYEHRLAA
ncbi:SOS response-associated peptidase family protein [Nevskia ramosa]|uniref:SOS response-associated peptidase family protein n=1 Tax=Nevskia ramosa TaxID=64002 RepID=UPI0023538005|nr:SOS response-associated peptidase family protein [Nevskia ramosa]